MSDFHLHNTAQSLEHRIRESRLLDIPVDWADDLIFPHFNGLSIMNLAQTIMGTLGVDVDSPLDSALWGDSSPLDGIERVVLFISDGLGYRYLQQLTTDNAAIRDDVHDITQGRGFVPLTSILPSTTVAALTTLWTGVPPGVHGIVGTIMFLKEVSMLSNILYFRPAVGKHQAGLLDAMGLDAATFVTATPLAQRLSEVGAETHLLMEKALMGSGLSKILHRGVEHRHTHRSTAEMWVRMRDVLMQTRGTKSYVHIYVDHVDRLSHEYGAHNVYTQTEIATQLRILRDLLNDEAVQDGKTLVLIAADHGHHDMPQHLNVTQDARLRALYDAMLYDFSAEARFGTFRVQSDAQADIIAGLHDELGNILACVDVNSAVASGMFGSGDLHPQLRNRLGNLLLLLRLRYGLIDGQHSPRSVSRHGGLDAWEMLVPLLWRRV